MLPRACKESTSTPMMISIEVESQNQDKNVSNPPSNKFSFFLQYNLISRDVGHYYKQFIVPC
jgi:hypothetical protein